MEESCWAEEYFRNPILVPEYFLSDKYIKIENPLKEEFTVSLNVSALL